MEFSLQVAETDFYEHKFTIGTAVNIVVPGKEDSDPIIIQGQVLPATSTNEPLETASCLALGDNVVVEMNKKEDGSWEVISIVHEAERGQEVGDFLRALEESLERYKVKYPQTFF